MKYRILALASLFMTGGAFASGHTGTFDVTASVADECQFVSKTDLAFGAYSPINGSAVDQASTVTVKCTDTTGYSVELGGGLNADVSDRRMVHSVDGTEFLGYSLFQDASRSVAWGIDATNSLTGQTGNGSNQVVDIFGRIAADQNVQPGSFSDTVAVSVVIN